jgi:hypothetical protein
MCFSLEWIKEILIWLICVAVIVALLRLVLPYVLQFLGVAGGIIMQAINIVIWGIILLFLVVFVFDLIGCFAGGLHMPGLH